MDLSRAVFLAGLGVLGLHAGGGWYFSNQIRSDGLKPIPPPEPDYLIEVLDVSDHKVTLASGCGEERDVGAAGLHGVVWPGGYGTVGRVVSRDAEQVVREFELLGGVLSPGDRVDLDGFLYRGDPLTSLDVPFETVSFPSPLGEMGAWHVPGEGDGWVIFVHGKSGPLREALRFIGAIRRGGMHALVINYRNDVGMPLDSSGFYRQGLSEWEDLAAAVEHARAQGADKVAIVGMSMGGAITASFLRESPLASEVEVVVLDSPMLDFGGAIDHQAKRISILGMAVPRSLVFAAKKLSSWRFGVEWNRLDYTAQADHYETPMLIFHGVEDDAVPIEPCRRLARARPDLVELVETEQAGHVVSWNVAPERYEARLLAFLRAAFQ